MLPLKRRNLSRLPAPFVPLPALLIDTVMPLLTDTEWRLLCVIARATLGWHDPRTGGRKTRDWLSQVQLKRRTGRASEAVSRAVDGLVRRGLITVTGASGELLATPALRRRWGRRLYFRLSTTLLSPSHLGNSSESELRKPRTTRETPPKE